MSTSRPPLEAGSWKEPKRMNEGLTRLQTAPGSILALPLQAQQRICCYLPGSSSQVVMLMF